MEYILDTLDYIQLHQEDLQEFQQLSNSLLTRLNENQARLETIGGDQLTTLNDDLEKYYEQVELLNQKGEILLQSSAGNANDENENQIEHQLENINRNYDSLTMNTKARLQHTDPVTPKTPSITTAEETVSNGNLANEDWDRSHLIVVGACGGSRPTDWRNSSSYRWDRSSDEWTLRAVSLVEHRYNLGSTDQARRTIDRQRCRAKRIGTTSHCPWTTPFQRANPETIDAQSRWRRFDSR